MAFETVFSPPMFCRRLSETGCPAFRVERPISLRLLRLTSYRAIAGDLVLYDFEGRGEAHHVEIVRAGLAWDGRFSTVGGNTRSGETGSQGEGDGVFVRRRALDTVRGWVGW